MEIKKYKADKVMFYADLLAAELSASVGIIVGALLLIAIKINPELPLGIFSITKGVGIGVIVMLILGAVILSIRGFYRYRNFEYYIENDTLCYHTSFLNKVKVALPLNRIHSINLKRDIFNLLTGSTKVLVDSGSVSSSFNEQFFVVLKKKRAEALYLEIKRLSALAKEGKTGLQFEGIIEKSVSEEIALEYVYRMGAAQYMLCGIMLKMFYGFVVAVGGGLALLLFAGDDNYFLSLVGATGAVFILLGGLLLSYFIATLIYYIRYYNYRVTRENNTINISYGLLVQKKFALQVDRINAVQIKQNPLMLLFGRFTLYLQVVGFGQSEGSVQTPPYLCMIASRKQIETLLKNVLNEFSFEYERVHVPKKSRIHYFIIMNIIILIVLSFVTLLLMCTFDSIAPWFLVLLAAFMLLLFINSTLAYNLSHAGICGDYVVIARGGFFTSATLIRYSAIQTVSLRRGFIRAKQGLGRVILQYRSNLGEGSTFIRHFDEKLIDMVQEKMDY